LPRLWRTRQIYIKTASRSRLFYFEFSTAFDIIFEKKHKKGFALEILLLLTYTSFFIFLIYKLPFFDATGISKKSITLVFILKILFGLILWAVYTFYYPNRSTADIYKYFDDSKIMFDALKTNPVHYIKMLFGIGNNTPEFEAYYAEMHYWTRKNGGGTFNDGHTVIRFNAFIRLFSQGYYTVHTVFICFLSLIGFIAIYKVFIPLLRNKKHELFLAVFLLPSVLFWGSGVLKEGLLFFTLGILIYYFQQPFTWKSFCICLIAGVLLALSKFYVWLALLPALFFLLVIRSTGTKKTFLKFSIVLILVAVIGTNIDRFSTLQNPMVTLSQKQIEFNSLAEGNTSDANKKNIPVAGSRIVIPVLQPTFLSFVKNAPRALWNVLFRPFPWEMRSALMILAGLENVFILFFLIICIIFSLPLAAIKWEYVLFCLSFAIIQFLIIGETTPVLGAIARYKVPSLPFLLIAFLFILDKEKLIKRFPVLTSPFHPPRL
jgi:hypothetical protein